MDHVTIHFIYSPVRPGLLVAFCLLVVAIAAVPVRTSDAPTCRELERRYDLVKADATSTQLSLALFGAADRGCVPLARRLLEAGASLAARDRLGAMALRSEERRVGKECR